MRILIKLIQGLCFIGILDASFVIKINPLVDRLSICFIFSVIVILCMYIEWKFCKSK